MSSRKELRGFAEIVLTKMDSHFADALAKHLGHRVDLREQAGKHKSFWRVPGDVATCVILETALERIKEVTAVLGLEDWKGVAKMSLVHLQNRVDQCLGAITKKYYEARKECENEGLDCSAWLANTVVLFKTSYQAFFFAGLAESDVWIKYFSHPPPPDPSAELVAEVARRNQETRVAAFNPSGVSIGQIDADDPAAAMQEMVEEGERRCP